MVGTEISLHAARLCSQTIKDRRGIILAGGSGSRLYPVTFGTCKQLLPVYDKPLVYYALTTLMLAGTRDILVVTTPRDVELFQTLLKDGTQWGVNISYAIQKEPKGLAQAFIIGEKFIDGHDSTLILGDNIFFGNNLQEDLLQAGSHQHGATVFGYHVHDPKRYGVVTFDDRGIATSLEEKPEDPKSNYAVTGLYFYDKDVCEIAKEVQLSPREEYEITDINKTYLERGMLRVEKMGRGYTYFDAGTHDSLLEASLFVKTIEHQQGLQVACPEEVSFRLGYINAEQVARLANPLKKTAYGDYLTRIIQEPIPHDWVYRPL